MSRARIAAFWGMALAMLFAYGCPNRQDPADPQQPSTILPYIKATDGLTINVPNRPPQPPATVAIIKDDSLNYSSMVSQALTAALGPGGISNLVHSGDTVLIKPNLVTSKALAVTDWHVVKALVDLIKVANGGANITIADGSASADSIAVMNEQGFTTANFGAGVTFANFNDTATNPTNTYVLADSRTGAAEKIPALITDADIYIDMPKMKTHYHAGMTGAVKNLGIGTGPMPVWNTGGNFGTGGTAKYGLHHDIRSEIVDHIACRVPDLSIMDALQGMEGQGPGSGTAVTMNLVLASKDPVAVDAVAATIMGIPPALITHLVLAANENIGVIDLNNISTTGNITLAAASAIHTFVRATPGAAQAPIEPGVIPYRATTVVRTAPAAMTIDGDLSEWGYANAMNVNAAYQVKGGGSGWSAADASVTAQALYDASNLYLAFTVKDNVKQANGNTGSAIVNGDGVELYLSTYLEQYNTTARSYGSTYDYHLAISYAATPQAYMLSHSRALTGAVFSKVETTDGYILEALIPWSNFGSPSVAPTALAAGYVEYRQIGLNVALNDADTSPSTVEHKLIWSNATDSDIETNPIKTGMSYIDPPGGLYPTLYFTLTTNATNGTVSKNPDQATYVAGTVVSLTATPAAGYVFAGWSGSASGTANPLSVTMDGKKTITANFQTAPVLTSITVSPASISVNAAGAQQFTTIAYDQNNNPFSPQPTFTWSASGGGTIDGSGLFTAGASAGGPFTVTAQSGSVSGTAAVTVTLANGAPTVVTPSAATPNPVTATTAALSVLGDDDGGESSLTYTWAATGTPPAAVTFSANGTNAAKNATATFTKAGSYTFQVTIKDQGNLTATSAVAVTVNQTLTTIVVAPTTATVNVSATQQFTATARDQFATALAPQPTFNWSVSGGGTISASGLFTAGTTGGGPYTVTAQNGSVSGTASVTVSSTPTAIYRINAGSTSAVSPFTADQYASGGTQRTVTNTITISGVTNPAPAAVYQSERYGASTYTLPNLTSGSKYTVRLHFAELYQTATGKRVFNVAINGTTVLSNFDIYSAAGGNYRAVVREFTATANSSGQIVIAFTTVTDNATIEGIEILTSTPNNAPTIATAAAASPNPVAGTTAALSVLGADDGGESNLTYTWATTGTPPAAVTFSANGTNAAKNTTATFTKAGSYTLQVTVKDQPGLTVTSTVAVTVNQTLTSIVLSPSSASIKTSATQQFTATARDQFTTNLTSQPTFTWTVSGGGTISTGGLFSASTSAGGPYTVTATSGTVNGTASVTVTLPNAAPTIATVAAANPNPVTGTTAALSVLGADDAGESNLTYAWATTGTPPAAVTFSANGTNAAKNTTATFTKAGSYTFQVTVKDQPGLTATSTVAVTVNQSLTSIVVSPSSASVNTSATQQFTATARDQFTTNLTTQPTFTWTVSGGGTISTGGLFTAGTATGGPYSVTAKNGSVSGTASITVGSAVVYQINCGSSSAASPFKADQYASGGTQHTVTNTITISGITNPAPQAVYQSERYGTSTYTFPSLTSGAQYTVRLHFAELYQTATGKRVFNVLINGTTVLSNFDIYATAGGNYRAVLREFTATANSSGQIVIKFNTVTDNATIEGIEIIKK
ncbi:MAG TPA: malectin domain-containing carbohydrate-binding protein [Polyangia bacterium]